MSVGDKIKFDDERQRYTVVAQDERFAILVKPFNARRTYLYSIVDLNQAVRGRHNRIFGIPYDVSTPDGAAAVLAELQAGTLEVSARNYQTLTSRELEDLRASAWRKAISHDRASVCEACDLPCPEDRLHVDGHGFSACAAAFTEDGAGD
ncbi:hypothetical protein [Novosphingobium guangzhouense]|uniref:Uncharacterized protein n=1 Tax=Novosphingobium guangzhouense TaxID=1850347 RepID=A0A2K2G484_9SPHN|nr:hypothetical protein [Novosphingobium guangzhouense]PNU05837.1 hypothetical protein A8V01_14830 [Novosphingobium guangzhouense]